MSKENYINKIKDLPESLRQFIGLIFITLIVIVSFSILNGIFGQGDDLVKRMKLEEERIAEEKKLSELISKLPSGILVSFDGILSSLLSVRRIIASLPLITFPNTICLPSL